MANKFKKGDNVIVITGNDKGKTGKILVIKDNKVIVEGVNVATIHLKPNSKQPGQIIKKEKLINISNISHVENGKAIKIKFAINKGDAKKFVNKDRISKKTATKLNNDENIN